MDTNRAGGAERTPLAAIADRRKVDQGPPAGTRERRRRAGRQTPSGLAASDALKMACPYCGHSSSAVVRSRGGIVGDKVTRRRECARCGERFPTYERLDEETFERELAQRHGEDVLDELLTTVPPPTWENAERLLHRLWGQAKDRQYVKNDWKTLQQVLAGLRRLS